jgi:hypothetical protein
MGDDLAALRSAPALPLLMVSDLTTLSEIQTETMLHQISDLSGRHGRAPRRPDAPPS